jgi:single-strand DNA-binding protein
LPSGDEVTVWRLVVERPDAPASARRGGTVDTVDCVARQKGLRQRVRQWSAGDVVEVEGALRRRFWKVPAGGVASRYEVEASRLRRLTRASP